MAISKVKFNSKHEYGNCLFASPDVIKRLCESGTTKDAVVTKMIVDARTVVPRGKYIEILMRQSVRWIFNQWTMKGGFELISELAWYIGPRTKQKKHHPRKCEVPRVDADSVLFAKVKI